MYITGNINDFIHRLHALPTGQPDLANFIIEGRGYLSVPFTTISGVYRSGIIPSVSGQWEKEARLQAYRLGGTGSGIMLSRQQF